MFRLESRVNEILKEIELYVNTGICLIELSAWSTEIFRNCFVPNLDVASCFIALSELQSLHNNVQTEVSFVARDYSIVPTTRLKAIYKTTPIKKNILMAIEN